MTTAFYAAFFEHSPTGYGVFFPDLPGCASAGRTAAEAAVNAREALALHIAGMVEDGDAIPPPTPLDLVVAPDYLAVGDGERIHLVEVELPGRSTRVNITLDEGLLAAIDRVAPNRSRFLADAARAALQARRV